MHEEQHIKGEMQVHLHKAKFYAFHGMAPGEEITGGDFEVSVTAFYTPALPVNEIAQTIDYTLLNEIVKNHMQRPTLLLETLATEIAGEIIAKFSIVSQVVVSIDKLHPPIIGFQGAVGVTFKLKRD